MLNKLFIAVIIFSFSINNALSSEIKISGQGTLELKNDYNYKSNDNNNEYNNLTAELELSTNVAINENISIDSVVMAEQFDRYPAKNVGDNKYFDSIGAYFEELKFNYKYNDYNFTIGKFNPAFGKAWDQKIGIWGHEFAESYELTEKLGLGLSVDSTNESLGDYTLSVSSFFSDTSFLNGSLITRRDGLEKEDGGAANTESLSSYVVSLEGKNPANIENLSYNVAYRYLSAGKYVGFYQADERGYVIGADYVLPLQENINLTILAEYSRIENQDGLKNNNVDYLTTALILGLDNGFDVTASYSKKEDKDYLFELSTAYEITEDIEVAFGYKRSEEFDVETDSLGLLASYNFDF